MQETLESLGANSWFSILDQGKAYHLGFMSPNSQPLMNFITPWGLYEWARIQFGAFQRFMKNFLGNSMDTVCVPCMYGIIIFSTSLDEHIESTHRVFRRLREHGVKLKPRKRKIFKR